MRKDSGGHAGEGVLLLVIVLAVLAEWAWQFSRRLSGAISQATMAAGVAGILAARRIRVLEHEAAPVRGCEADCGMDLRNLASHLQQIAVKPAGTVDAGKPSPVTSSQRDEQPVQQRPGPLHVPSRVNAD